MNTYREILVYLLAQFSQRRAEIVQCPPYICIYISIYLYIYISIYIKIYINT